MRELQRLDRNGSGHGAANGAINGSGFRRNAPAWLTITALLGLYLSQPFHNAAPIAWGHASGHASDHGLDSAALVVAAGGEQPAQRAAHDADLCSVCRATTQTRQGLRVFSCLGALATSGACLPLQLPAPALASAAPALRSAQPRAPPTSLRVLSA